MSISDDLRTELEGIFKPDAPILQGSEPTDPEPADIGQRPGETLAAANLRIAREINVARGIGPAEKIGKV